MTMFETGKTYWFVVKSEKFGQVTTKGKVLDETDFLIKILRDNGDTEIISISQILRTNEDKSDKKQIEETQM
jgi:hypothetical protein